MATKSIEEAPTSIRIGPADLWGWDQQTASTRDDKLAFLFEAASVSGRPRAKIEATGRPGQWTFSVSLPGQSGRVQRAQCCYGSKEAALEGLRAWLASNQQ